MEVESVLTANQEHSTLALALEILGLGPARGVAVPEFGCLERDHSLSHGCLVVHHRGVRLRVFNVQQPKLLPKRTASTHQANWGQISVS